MENQAISSFSLDCWTLEKQSEGKLTGRKKKGKGTSSFVYVSLLPYA